MTELTPEERLVVEAADTLRRASAKDPLVRSMTAKIAARAGCKDLVDWVDQHPDEAVAVAAQVRSLGSQVDEMAADIASRGKKL